MPPLVASPPSMVRPLIVTLTWALGVPRISKMLAAHPWGSDGTMSVLLGPAPSIVTFFTRLELPEVFSISRDDAAVPFSS